VRGGGVGARERPGSGCGVAIAAGAARPTTKAQRVCAVRAGVDPGPGDRALHEVVDRLRVQAAEKDRLPLLTGRSAGPAVMAAASSQVRSAVTGSGRVAGPGEDHQLGGQAVLLVLDRGRARTRPLGCSAI
jgi:hypothetical protein